MLTLLRPAAAAGLAVLCTTPVLAQSTTHPGDVLIQGNLTINNGNGVGDLYVEDDSTLDGNVCIGNTCSTAETYANSETLRLKYTALSIQFQDTSGATAPGRDWTLRVNDEALIANGGIDRFSVEDDTANTTPFTIAGGVPSNAFWLDTTGDIGLGTSIPQTKLHLLDPGAETAIRMTKSGGGSHTWQLTADDTFEITDVTDGRAALHVDTAGNVGIGTSSPGAPLTVSSPGTFTFFRIEALGASPNTAADMTFTGGPNGNGEYRINVVDGDGPEMRVDAEGFVIATTGFKVGGTTLTVPDYVFAPEYELRPLSEVAAFVQENNHLPDVPSAADVARDGLDMTQMQMALLKKIEELTLYTLEQEQTIAEQRAELDDLRVVTGVVDSLQERVDRMEKLGKYK